MTTTYAVHLGVSVYYKSQRGARICEELRTPSNVRDFVSIVETFTPLVDRNEDTGGGAH
jgi:hypothetical protein